MDITPPEPDAALDHCARVVVDAALEVHRAFGPAFQESIYEEALAMELALRGVSFTRQVTIPLHYKGALVGHARLDLIVGDRLVVELKAVEQLTALHAAQVLSYLKAARKTLGLLINFNVPYLRQGIKRLIRNQ